MSLVKANAAQIGQSVTATNNFTMYQPASPDGTVRWGVGNSGSVTDIVTLNSSGYVGIGISSPNARLNVQDTTANNGTIWLGGATYYSTIKQDAVSTGALLFNVATANGGATLYQWQKGGTTQMTLDSSGNLGLGVTPKAWQSGLKAFEVGYSGTAIVGASATNTVYYNNAYNDGSNKYASTGEAAYYQQTAGKHVWATAPSGTAGNAISFTQAMTLDASGNLGIGTSSPASKLDVKCGSGSVISRTTSGIGFKSFYDDGRTTFTAVNYDGLSTNGAQSLIISAGVGASQGMIFNTSDTERMRIDSSGNVGIGTSSPTSAGARRTLTVDGASGADFYLKYGGTEVLAIQAAGTSGPNFYYPAAGYLTFNTSGAGTERVRIDSSGGLLVGTTTNSAGGAGVVAYNAVASQNAGYFRCTSSTYAADVLLATADRNTTNGSFNAFVYYNYGAAAYKFKILDSGTAQNTTGSYTTISDLKLKENIVDSSPQLDKLMQTRVVNYNLIGDDLKQIGWVAQELEQVYPGLVFETPDRTPEEDLGTTTKGVKLTVFIPILVKAIQEQQAIIESLTQRIEQLEAK